MTVAPHVDRAHRAASGTGHGPPPLRWWLPAVVFAVAAVVLTAVVVAVGTNNGPLDDPNQAYQRDGALHHGPQLAGRVGGIAFDSTPAVVLFTRRQPTSLAFAGWSAAVTRNGTRLIVAIAGRPGTPALRDAVGMRRPNDGGEPVGYAIVDWSRRVRYATLDPGYLDHAAEVALLTAGLTGHAS